MAQLSGDELQKILKTVEDQKNIIDELRAQNEIWKRRFEDSERERTGESSGAMASQDESGEEVPDKKKITTTRPQRPSYLLRGMVGR